MSRSGAIIGSLALLVFSVARLPAQEATCIRHTVVVNVLDREGFPIAGFTEKDFNGEFRGKPVRILSAAIDERPKRIVVLLDASGSMLAYPDGKWKLALEAVRNIFASAPVGTSLALLVFGTKIDEKVGFAEGRAAAVQKLKALEPGRKAFGKGERRTALFDAILEGLSLLGSPQPGDVIYAITDGGENRSHNKARKVEQAVLSAGVRLDVLLLSLGQSSVFARIVPEEFEGARALGGFIEATGGSLLLVTGGNPNLAWFGLGEEDRSALKHSLERLNRQMGEVYRLEVELPQPVDKPRNWKLELVAQSGINNKELRLVYPRKLMPCQAGKPLVGKK